MNAKGAIAPAALGIVLGVMFGLGFYTFGYAKGASYLTNDPKSCANCHVMNEQYDGWLKSSHRNVAVCNDCHTPPGFIPKYYTKALNGFNHSLAFTTGWFPEVIRINARNHAVTEASCAKCHQDIISGINSVRHQSDQAACVTCHRSVGHLH